MHKIDQKIIHLISVKPLHTSEIARNIIILRTTAQYRLKKLEKAGLIKSYKNGKKTMWTPIFKSEHNKSHFKIYRGTEIVQAYKQLLNLPKHTSILAIQGVNAAKKQFSALPDIFIKEAHKVFKKKGIILRGIINKKVLNIFNEIDSSLALSHKGRTMGIKIFSGNNFLGSGEIMATKKMILLANPKLKQAIVIKDKDIVTIVYEVLQLVFDTLDREKSFDLNNYLETEIFK